MALLRAPPPRRPAEQARQDDGPASHAALRRTHAARPSTQQRRQPCHTPLLPGNDRLREGRSQSRRRSEAKLSLGSLNEREVSSVPTADVGRGGRREQSRRKVPVPAKRTGSVSGKLRNEKRKSPAGDVLYDFSRSKGVKNCPLGVGGAVVVQESSSRIGTLQDHSTCTSGIGHKEHGSASDCSTCGMQLLPKTSYPNLAAMEEAEVNWTELDDCGATFQLREYSSEYQQNSSEPLRQSIPGSRLDLRCGIGERVVQTSAAGKVPDWVERRRQAIAARLAQAGEHEGAVLEARQRLDERLRTAGQPNRRQGSFSLRTAVSGWKNTSMLSRKSQQRKEDAQHRGRESRGGQPFGSHTNGTRTSHPSMYSREWARDLPALSSQLGEGIGIWRGDLAFLERYSAIQEIEATRVKECGGKGLDQAAIDVLTRETWVEGLEVKEPWFGWPRLGKLKLVLGRRTPLGAHESKTAPEDGVTTRDCPICLDNFTAGEVLLLLRCGHRFHEGCIVPWLSHQRRCPYCRSTVT